MTQIIFDWKRTLYDPDQKVLIEGTREILAYFQQQKAPLILIGKGGEEMIKETRRLKVFQSFAKVIFREGPKDETLFTPFISANNPQLTIVVGDRIQSEIAIANKLKATTIWVKQGKFADELPLYKSQKPTHTVNSLKNLLKFFKIKNFLNHNDLVDS